MATATVITRPADTTDYVREGQPCVLAHGLHDWPAFQRWTPAHLQSICAQRPVIVQVSHSGSWRYNVDGSPADPFSQYGLPNVPFDKAVDLIVNTPPSGPKYYISQSDIRKYPRLANDLRFSRPIEAGRVNLWFGSSGTISQLHYDTFHNTFAQVYGRKTIILFDPTQTSYLYPNPRDSPLAHLSPIDVGNADLDKYPLFKNASKYVVTIQPGEILFLPAFWWHYVRAEDVSISVNQWWPPELEECRGDTAVRTWLRRYRVDGWCQYRAAHKIGRMQLLDGALRLLETNSSLAVIAATVALDDILRWPRDANNGPVVRASTKDTLYQMMAAVTDGQEEVLDPHALRLIVHELREVAEADDSVPS